MTEAQSLIEAAFADRSLLKNDAHRAAVLDTVAALDAGTLRVATCNAPGDWTTHAWIKQAVLLYFAVSEMQKMSVGPFEFYDKIPLKHDLDKAGVRVVPPGTVR
jgi:2,3,4,5-tetrahydropyridine-2-carboxylate N-succinyltransferase